MLASGHTCIHLSLVISCFPQRTNDISQILPARNPASHCPKLEREAVEADSTVKRLLPVPSSTSEIASLSARLGPDDKETRQGGNTASRHILQ